ncbi:MAG: type II secretion system F family protein [Eggerthellaceae bacterium]|nr:type II secretion system F family protein [Eggerthellaceae bacterium]
MKTFNYSARALEGGGQVTGVAEANTREEALRQLRDNGLIVEQISEVGDSKRDLDLRLGGGKTKEKELSITCNQFAILLQAGLPITRTLELIANQTEDKTLQKVLKEAADEVAAGYSLADSLEKHGDGLPTTFIESVRAGEESGSLDTVFRRLSTYFEKSSRTKAKVKSAMIYPTFVMVIAVVVVAIIMIFAVPVFSQTFEGMGQELPAITQFVVASSDFWVHWWWLVALLIFAAVIGVKLAKQNDAFHLKWSELGIRIPVLGRINTMNAASQYAGTMSVMMSAGLPIVKAVAVTARSMTNYYMGRSLENILPDLEAGKPLAACLRAENKLPELAIEMTAVGEQTGSLETTMEVISEYYDNEVETSTSRAMSILEPMIIVVLALIVFVLLLSVYLPLFGMYGGVS